MNLIFANGDLSTTAWIQPYLNKSDVIIAVDGGLRHLQALNIRPDILIGDMDSSPHQLPAELEAAGIQLIYHSRAKDETDLELALIYAAQHYSGPLLVFGVSGGRLDQTVANVLLLAHPALTGREVFLLTEHQRAWLVRGTTTITGKPGDRVSLLPIGGAVEIGQTAGLQWPLIHETLIIGPARGISNVMVDFTASVQVKSGLLLCVHTVGEWER